MRQLEWEIKQLQIENNRAASSTQREADIGKARDQSNLQFAMILQAG